MPRKPTAKTKEPKPPASEKLRRLGLLLANGMQGTKAAKMAGFTGRAAEEGVTAAKARKHPWVRWQIEQSRAVLVETAFAAIYHVRVGLGIEKEQDGSVASGGRLSLKEAVDHAMSRHFLQAAGLLAPDTTPPPSAAALADAIVGAVPPDKLPALLARAAEDARRRHHEATAKP